MFEARFEKNGFDLTPSVTKEADKTIVVALVDQGSGNVRYEVSGIDFADGVLIVHVIKFSPMIQTMDFVSWVMHLELDKNEFSKITYLQIQEL